VSSVHEVVGYVVVGVFAVGWLWGLGAWVVKRGPGQGFWAWLTVEHVVAGVQAVLGLILLLLGRRPTTWLHYVYGIGPFVVLAIGHVMAREIRNMAPNPKTGRTIQPATIFAWASFICFGLTLRALMTGLGTG
jgi:hypothetical protein